MEDRSEQLRRAYAAEVCRRAGVRDPRVEAAFAAVPREDFSGPPPWSIAGGFPGAERTDDLERLYDDVLVAIDPSRGINNGQPSLHAECIEALALKGGEAVAHVGAGAGYYSAILAHLVGPTGKVFAYEIETDIAERARASLIAYRQVEVLARSGVEGLPPVDCIYVNAAASHPAQGWLDALKVGGRLLFPMHAARSSGAMLLVTRPRQGHAWPAKFFGGVVFIACQGAQDPAVAARLDEALRRGGLSKVKSLRIGGPPHETDWLRGDGWALSTDEASGVQD